MPAVKDALGEALDVSISLPLEEITGAALRELLRDLRHARRAADGGDADEHAAEGEDKAEPRDEGAVVQLEMLIMAADVLCCLHARVGEAALGEALGRVGADLTMERHAAGVRGGKAPLTLTASNLVEVALAARLALSSASAAQHLDHVLHPTASGASHVRAREASRARAAQSARTHQRRSGGAVDLEHNSAHASDTFKGGLRAADSPPPAPKRRPSPSRGAAAASRFARPQTPERVRHAAVAKTGLHTPVKEMASKHTFREGAHGRQMSARNDDRRAETAARRRRMQDYGNEQSMSNSPSPAVGGSGSSASGSSASGSSASGSSGEAGGAAA